MEHHAYFYEGPLVMLGELATNARELFNFEEHPSTELRAGNPDVQVREFEKFGIEDSQALRELATFKSTSGRALFVIGIGSITSEAQQALLKLFEEPSAGSIFVLLVPHGVLLPTLRSRLMAYPENLQPALKKVLGSPSGSAQPDYFLEQSADFLKAPYKTRSTSITSLLKDEEGAKERVRTLLAGLEAKLHELLLQSSGKKEYRDALEDIAKVRSYVNDRSPSLKMLLEHLAATLPQL